MSGTGLPSTMTPTHPLYKHDSRATTLNTTLSALQTPSDLAEADQALFSKLPESAIPPDTPRHIITVPSTIFYAQGGGQPCDTGIMLPLGDVDNNTKDTENEGTTAFNVVSVRHSSANAGTILHYGHFAPGTRPKAALKSGHPLRQEINVATRKLHSRIHTAGHVLGLAIRLLARAHPADFPQQIKEGKAQHYPSRAAVEFYPAIDGKWKAEIEKLLNELVEKDLTVGVEWWTGQEVLVRSGAYVAGVEDLVESIGGEKLRVIDVRDGGVPGAYPCGGTHVEKTKECGPVRVRKISKGKETGWCQISYAVNGM